MRFADFLPETTRIIRDGQFSSLGSLFSHYPQQLVYATREADIKKIVDNPSISCVITIPELVSEILKMSVLRRIRIPKCILRSPVCTGAVS